MQLRPYQREALRAVRESYRAGHRSVLVVMPTGTGKTLLFAEISRLAKGPVLVLAHRQELVEQAREKVSAWCDDVVAVEMAHRRDFTAADGHRPKITVASIQSMSRRLEMVDRSAFKIVIIDEAHHSTADTYKDLIAHFDAWVLGVTATPDRGDKQPLGEVFSAVAFQYDMLAAIRDGWLCPIRSFLVKTEIDFSGVRKIAGELATVEVERILTEEPHLAEVAHPIVAERDGRPTMVFAASVAHAHALSRVLCEFAGDRAFAAALDGTSDTALRRTTIARFRSGEIKVLVNCSLFTEGFDVPAIAMVAIARPVLSRSFYAQMVGRGTRLAVGKANLLVLDFVPGNCRHRLVQAFDIFGGGDEKILEEARRLAMKASDEGESIALEQALELARQVCEARAASVDYELLARDPFAAIGLVLPGRPGGGASGDSSSRGEPFAEPATATQLAYLRRAGMPSEQLGALSKRQAYDLSEQLRDRKASELSTPRQVKQLAAFGVDARQFYFERARAALSYIRREKKTRPIEDIRAELEARGSRILDIDESAG